MELKKLMLVALILLVILTIGTVSANDDGDFNETLTVESNQKVSVDTFNDNNLNENEITEDSFSSWVSGHETVNADWNPWIATVHSHENLEEGDVNLTIFEDNTIIFSDVKSMADSDENNDVYWTLDELREYNILNHVGNYNINLKYINEGNKIYLGDYTFKLTQFEYNTYEGDIYIAYPFDVIRVWDEDVDVKVYVNNVEVNGNGGEDPLRWTLSDLDIAETGHYNITIKANKDEYEEEISFNLNVDDDSSFFRLISNNFGVQYWELDNPILYLISPNDMVRKTVKFIKNDEESDLLITDTVMNWTLDDLGIEQNGALDIRIVYDDEDLARTFFDVWGFDEGNEFYVDVWNSDEKGNLYTDTEDSIIYFWTPDYISGMLDIIINNQVKFHTIISPEKEYKWDLKSLNMTKEDDYNITLKFMLDDEKDINKEYLLNVKEFDNSTFRAKIIKVEDEGPDFYLFTPSENKTGTVTLYFKRWDDEEERHVLVDEKTFELNESYSNSWTQIVMPDDCDNVDIKINGEEIYVEYWDDYDTGNYFEVNDREIFTPDDVVVWVYADTIPNEYTINITSGNYSFIKNVCELGDYEWNNRYIYFITLRDLNSFDTLEDKDKVVIFYDVDGGKSLNYRWIPYSPYTIQKDGEFIRLYDYEDLRVDLIKIDLTHGEDEEDEEDSPSNSSQEDNQIIKIIVPDSLNIHETALVHITYGNYKITKKISDLYNEYNYGCLGINYYISSDDLNLKNIHENDVINISVTSNDELIGFKNFIGFYNEDGYLSIDYFSDSIDGRLYYGTIGDLEFGQSEDANAIISISIPKLLNITDGTVMITDENGEVIFSKALSELEKSDSSIQTEYTVSDDMNKFDYSIFKENVPFTLSFTYDNKTIELGKGVMEGNELHRINTPKNIAEMFKITIYEGIMINGSENAIIIEATDDANRQSVGIDLGGGYFVVYVNDKKVEDLGRLIRFDNETELELFRLSGGSRDGLTKLYIYLSDLNITDNGEYNIRVTHQSESGSTNSDRETELFNNNITLTSNVKVNNVTSEVFTGFGMDPILLYLDTYYGNINETNGKITVLNSAKDILFESDIKDLSSENGKYYLKYSDFKNKKFGDNIIVKYSDGNERNGNTTVNVTWKDVDPEVFNPIVNDDISDYYGNFVNLNIPDLINTGQVIVTLKFKNNHNSPISNMNVTTDFGSQAVYKFNIADIKDNYDNNDFNLALSDLGFYETNGDYEAVVQFTADGTNLLDITNNTLKVELLKEILLNINESSRYSNALPFASAQVFEPISAYAELYIDGALFSHKTFEKGLITFDSSDSWTPGNHTAELIVYNSEFGTMINSTTINFETLINTDDVDVIINDTIKENENVFVTITVPKGGEATIQIDNNEKTVKKLTNGLNRINLGVLTHGNHTIWISYNTTLDDGNVSFYNNYLTFFVGDDGRWLSLPQPLVLNDDDTIKMDFGSDAKGYVLVKIDDKLINNVTLVNGIADVTLSDLTFGENKYGVHTYNITYSGDETHDSLSQTGTFNVTYLFKDDINVEGYPLKEVYIIVIYLPPDATSTVTINSAGKTYTESVKDGKATFNLDNLIEGENIIDVSYSGDATYPADSYKNILNVTYYSVIGDLSGDKKFISLMLPENATGNLTIYNDNRHAILFSKALVNGKISIDLNDLPVGIYEIRAYYEGVDYDVKTFNGTFKVLPEVNITQDVVIGENATITMDLNEASGNILIVFDGLSPVLQDIVNGKMIYTFSTEDLSYGNHSITFQYFGTNFDSTVFYELNEQTGRYIPIEYVLSTLPKIVPVELDSDEVTAYILVGNATGTIEVYVNGVFYDVVDIVNGIAKLDLSAFKNGEYVITWKYSGDDKYAPFIQDTNITINNKITAKNLNMLYSSKSKYSVKVYGMDGKVVKNTKVTFLINGKTYGSAKTNKKGVATIVIKKNPGSYKITSKALGVKITKKLNVKHIVTLKKVTVKRSAKKLVLTATLKKVNKKYLKGKKVTFKFNGKKYVVKTNKKGVAKVTIKKAVLKKLKVGKKIKYQATYVKDTVKKTVKVKK